MSEARAQRGARNPATLLRRAERFRLANEARDDQTRQRRFERRFLSVDMPDSVAARADWSDLGRQVRQLVRALDDPFRRQRRLARMNRAAARLPRKSVWLRPLLWAIYRNGPDREKTMAELGISKSSYWWGVNFLLKFYSA